MPFQQAVDRLTDSDNLLMVANLVGGYFVTEQIVRRLVDSLGGEAGLNVPDETHGVLTASAMYGYGGMVFSQSTANQMAMGGLLNSVDELSNRPAVRNLVGGGQ